jgi:guanine deaminase
MATVSQAETKAFRASILDFVADPRVEADSYRYFKDGLLVVKDGRVQALGSFEKLKPTLAAKIQIVDWRGHLLMPGFVDTHVHYPQTEMIASYGEQLLEWLNKYTFPTERKYKNFEYSRSQSEFFLQELLRNGTTTALVFATVHPESTEAFFQEAERLNLRMIGGKVMMDRNAPEYLQDTAESSYQDSLALLEKWHGRGRLSYAITPRFAPTSTPEQLAAAGALKKAYPDAFVHTHISENKDEVEWVKSLFPEHKGYLDVYDSFGLVDNRSVFAHGIHLTDAELARMSEARAAISFCPTSNLFLGSGLFPLDKAKEAGVRVGMGTDVGAGTSFSMLETLNEAYKVMQLRKQKLSALEGFYQATLGGAKSLDLDRQIGNFNKGKEADFVVMQWSATRLQKLRQSSAQTLEDRLFALMMLGDERNVRATYIMGEQVKLEGK